ncbi:hypothetical protein BB734_23110 [Mycobacterium avium subsp. hominissuis]|uniref:Uncharacterized protein n=4 Tax=Mycobacterium avium complex (MAC) TaxID=120793 RepID=A0A2A3LEG7_MYCAV|nr:Hypothetical protein MIP_04258 [Mycobacterium intracellulare subsp. intracellulare MTCC 9506]APT10386.1 hypothetical protein BS641_09030 [Mycobacterium avium subsp. hominissuis]ARV82727.1 hypothetical protein BWK49_16585 [Mycobacterium intracellulare subsp. chimaera]ASW95899.1 hypothetical protein CKJ67_14725 [Mycobacterium intracellulare]ELR85581.1 hypothetical protein W7U_10175 [Mycobacterium sp. H4Y]ETZ29334.1 putative lipoprotein [Mycobacterium intracellulare MIN_052511_1280]ETZ37696.1
MHRTRGGSTIGGSNFGCDANYTGPGPTEFSLFAKVIGPAGVKGQISSHTPESFGEAGASR